VFSTVRIVSLPSRPSPIPDPDAFAEQKQLVEAALRLDAEMDTSPTVSEVCAEAEMEKAVFERHFEAVDDLEPAFYDLTLEQYRMLTEATTGYEDFSFEERLASFYYILLDALGEQRGFVQATFDSRVRYRSSFRAEVRATLRELLTDADVVPNTNQLVTGLWPVHEVLTEVTFALIRHWIRDETEDQEATTALVDKLVAFVAELVTFGGVSRGVDLAWYLVQHDALGLGRLPVVGRFFSGR
jgi:methylphosphotriester-DNA--protein-cysteine methyltransferase